jgi:DNA-binding CsgD family transcriptional regulator
LSLAEPDAAIAAVLDTAAGVARDRGAAVAAANLSEHSLRLTPAQDSQEVYRRTLFAARANQSAGEWTRARSLVADLLKQPDADAWRVEALMLLAELSGLAESVALLEEALAAARGRPEQQAIIQCRLAWAARLFAGRDHAGAAMKLAQELGNEGLVKQVQAVQAFTGWFHARGHRSTDLIPLLDHLPLAVGGERLMQEATLAVVNTLAPLPARESAREFFRREQDHWHERDEPRSARASWGLAWIEFFAGCWELAAQYADRAHDIAIQYGIEVPQDHLPVAVIAVHRGLVDVAVAHSTRALDLAREQFSFHPPQHCAVLGLVALERGDVVSAGRWFDTANAKAADLGWREPSLRWWLADQVEMLLQVGDLNTAGELLEHWRQDASKVGRTWISAHCTRCDGLQAAAVGDMDRALALLAAAVTEHVAVGDTYGHSRALLALGVAQRRNKQKRLARESLEAARIGFEALGAANWVGKTRDELARFGGRARSSGLSPTELRVASLVAQGHTNREIAAALFLGERTVATHLTHVYSKLGVRSRTELASHLHAVDSG